LNTIQSDYFVLQIPGQDVDERKQEDCMPLTGQRQPVNITPGNSVFYLFDQLARLTGVHIMSRIRTPRQKSKFANLGAFQFGSQSQFACQWQASIHGVLEQYVVEWSLSSSLLLLQQMVTV